MPNGGSDDRLNDDRTPIVRYEDDRRTIGGRVNIVKNGKKCFAHNFILRPF